jgi:GNAT superfamily N-acetyltransferase
MSQFEFVAADIDLDRQHLIELNVEYVSWVLAGMESSYAVPAVSILEMTASQYVPTVIDKICGAKPPAGVFYLIKADVKLVGMGGLRSLDSSTAEIKRIYIRPEFRGHNLGERILQRLLRDAKSYGFTRACLDTAPFMTSAHRIYERNGFVDCPAYEGSEVPQGFTHRWRYFQRTL